MVELLLKKASELKMKSIALPALGTGTLGFPRDVVAQIMIDSVFKFSKATSNTSLKEIRFVAYHMDIPTISSFKKEFKNFGNSDNDSKNQGTGVRGAVAQTNVRRAPRRTSSTRSSASDSQLEDTADFSIVLGPLTVELVHGEITEENTDAIVVVGNESLNFGGAVGRAIIRKEGASFKKKVKKNGPQKQMTKLLSTTKMPSKHVLHLVPPSADYPSYKDMLKATSQLFVDAEKHKLQSISVPAIGSGSLNYPPQKSASIILLAIADSYMMKKRSSLRKVRIVIFEEPMLETFREEIMKILESPETYLENLDDYKGIMDWMKGRGKAALHRIKKFFTNSVTSPSNPANSWANPGKMKASMVRPRKANEFDDVTFLIYSTDQRNIQKAKNRIEKMVNDNIALVTTKKPGFAKLSAKQKTDIEIKARSSDVSVKFEEDGTLTFVGYHEDTSKIMDYCHEVVLEKTEEDSQIEEGNLMAEIVQWVAVADNNRRTEYEPEVNMGIEEAYKNDEKA